MIGLKVQRADLEYLHRLFVRHELGGFWQRHTQGVAPFQPSATAPDRHLLPFVERNAWIVQCPFCERAQMATPEFPRFFCIWCLHRSIGHAWIEVWWPSEQACHAVEVALEARPDPDTRCWRPHESVGVLIFENVQHGLYDPVTGEVAGDIGQQSLIPALTAAPPALAGAARLSLGAS